MVSSTSQRSAISFDKIPVRAFVIGNAVIGGEDEGIQPEILFHLAKNPHDPFAQQLTSEMPKKLERIRELGDQIKPIKKDYDLFAPSPLLSAEMEEYKGCNVEQIAEIDRRKIRINDSLPGNFKRMTYQELQDIASGKVPIRRDTAAYHNDKAKISHDIKYAIVTQNDLYLARFMNSMARYIIPVNVVENPYEILGGPRPGETLEQVVYRDSLEWVGVYATIKMELAKGLISYKDGDFSAVLVPGYGFDEVTVSSLGYGDKSATPIQQLTIASRSIREPRNSMIQMYFIDGKYMVGEVYKLYEEIGDLRGHLQSSICINASPKSDDDERTSESSSLSSSSSQSSEESEGATVQPETRAESAKPASEHIFPQMFTELHGSKHCKILRTYEYRVTELPVDAIAIEMDEESKILPKGEVSKEIVDVVGEEALQKEFQEIDALQPGAAYITEAGKLQELNGTTKILVHTATINTKSHASATRKLPHYRATVTMSRLKYSMLQKNYSSILSEVLEYNASKPPEYKVHTLLMPLLGEEKGYIMKNSASRCISVLKNMVNDLKEHNLMVLLGCNSQDVAQYAIDAVVDHIAARDT
mgnify:CR=1 FL=1